MFDFNVLGLVKCRVPNVLLSKVTRDLTEKDILFCRHYKICENCFKHMYIQFACSNMWEIFENQLFERLKIAIFLMASIYKVFDIRQGSRLAFSYMSPFFLVNYDKAGTSLSFVSSIPCFHFRKLSKKILKGTSVFHLAIATVHQLSLNVRVSNEIFWEIQYQSTYFCKKIANRSFSVVLRVVEWMLLSLTAWWKMRDVSFKLHNLILYELPARKTAVKSILRLVKNWPVLKLNGWRYLYRHRLVKNMQPTYMYYYMYIMPWSLPTTTIGGCDELECRVRIVEGRSWQGGYMLINV